VSESPLTHPEFQRHWRIVTVAGLLGTIYFTCTASAPRTKFLVELKATAFDFGVISSLSAVMLAFQILSGLWTNRTRRRKPVWMSLYIVHRLLFLLVLAAPALFSGERVRIWWIIGVLAANSALANLGNPMWFSWMSDLVPHESLNVHWAVRQRFISACNIAAQLAVAFAFNHFEARGQIVLGFIVLGIAGTVLGVGDICLFALVPEPPHERVQDIRLREVLIEPLRNADFRPYLLFRAYWNFAIMVSAPFFGVYLIKEMKLSTLTVQLTFITSSLGVVLASRLWGMLCDTYGHRPALTMVAAAKPLVPLCYILVPPIPVIAVPILALMSLVDGMVNAGGQIATQGVMLKDTPRRNRAMYIGATNFLALGVAGGLAPFIAGALIEPLTTAFAFDVGGYHFSGYHLIFLVSFFLRAGSVPLARRLREPHSLPTRTVLSYLNRAASVPAVRAVTQLHDSADEETRVRAALQLGRLRSPLAIKELIRALQDRSDRVRTAAADALGRIGMSDAAEALALALLDPDTGVQSRAARALGYLPSTGSVEALVGNLTRLDSTVLGETVRSLARLGDPAAIVPLILLLQEVDEPRLRRRITAALLQLTGANSLEEVLAIPRPLSSMLPDRPFQYRKAVGAETEGASGQGGSAEDGSAPG